ncbi:MAG: methionine gamma-lyase family protein [Clostridia bacterium]|nr:methionine gamma-lyase family protein [Clostridia bacterium]
MNSLKLIKTAEEAVRSQYRAIDETAYTNQVKVLEAFQRSRVSTRHFSGTTGYGYGDEGRDVLGQVYADVFRTEAGICSPHMLSGTHALTVALFGILRPGDRILFASGMPYDTLRGVVFGEGNGSLKDYGITNTIIDLNQDGKMDAEAIRAALAASPDTRMVYIQRSRGYELRDAFSCKEIGEICSMVRAAGFTGCIFVDNCYGEFVETTEPTEVGADVIVGSLIKNPGGGIAQTGGYICGKSRYIEAIGQRLVAPSVGLEVGSFEPGYRNFYEGLFMAPHITAQALKISILISYVMQTLGYKCYPDWNVTPHDITRAIEFGDEKAMVTFIREIQYASPVDSYVTCEPWDMPGYDDKIIMAAGTFVSGASIELSADGPVKPPYIAYFQGGLTYEHGRYALKRILDSLLGCKG